MPQLRLHSPAFIPGLGSDLPIPGNDVTVGRSPDNQLVIPEASVSLHHARIQQTPQGWVLTDLGDTNGIWIGVRRVDRLQLTAGQLFRIGGVALEFIEDGQQPALIDEKVNPDGPLSGSTITQGSGVRQTGASQHEAIRIEAGARSDPTQVNPPDWELPTDPEPPGGIHPAGEPLRSAPPSSRRRMGGGALVAGLLGLLVLGFAVTLGAVFALRWLTKVRQPTRRAVVTTTAPPAASPSQRVAPPPALPPITLADHAIEALDVEQRVEVPGVLTVQLPARALGKATHLVVARAPALGVEFCGATRPASNPVEIVTAYNAHWAEPANLEMSVDAEQLEQSGVPTVAIGLRDPADEVWHLLPTAYDPERRVARVQLWQPGFVALFFLKGPDVVSTSEHFALLREPKPEASASATAERPERALSQLEAALSAYRKMGFRISDGMRFVCASQANPRKSAALLPVLAGRELTQNRSTALARAAFATVVPAYLNTGSMRGREFWFSAMYDALARQAIGVRPKTTTPSFKRLASPLTAEDWPGPALYLNLLAKLGDSGPDLFRIWSETTRVMSELDARSGNQAQSPVLAIDLALQQMTQKSLLEHHTNLVTEQLLSERGRKADQLRSREVCSQGAQLAVQERNGKATLDVPSSFTARWLCLVIAANAPGTRLVHLQLAADAPSGVALRLLDLGSGQIVEPGLSASRAVRLDVRNNQVLVLGAVNASMSQAASIGLRFDDVTPLVSLQPAEASSVWAGQEIPWTLELTGAPEELKTVSVQWDFGDGTAKARSEWTVNAKGMLRVAQAHAWAREGSHTERAVVFDAAQPGAELVAAARTVSVQAIRLELLPNPAPAAPRTDVKLQAKATGLVPEGALYRFDFGDGSRPATTVSPEVTHQYSDPGEYAVITELLAGPGSHQVLATARTTLSIRSAESQPSDPAEAQPVGPAAAGATPEP